MITDLSTSGENFLRLREAFTLSRTYPLVQ